MTASSTGATIVFMLQITLLTTLVQIAQTVKKVVRMKMSNYFVTLIE